MYDIPFDAADTWPRIARGFLLGLRAMTQAANIPPERVVEQCNRLAYHERGWPAELLPELQEIRTRALLRLRERAIPHLWPHERTILEAAVMSTWPAAVSDAGCTVGPVRSGWLTSDVAGRLIERGVPVAELLAQIVTQPTTPSA